jgi:uncharacterized glyoxalase superfamily protein PhnB
MNATAAATSSRDSEAAAATVSDVIPFLRYRDARAAIAWLVGVLGVAEKAVFATPDGAVQHAELALGNSVVMLGPAKDDAIALRDPREVGGSSQGICLVVDDPEVRYGRAVQTGTELVRDLADTHYGSRGFTCRDPEGHLWTVDTYRPAGGGSLNPYLHYDAGSAMLDWLERAYGMERTMVVPGPADTIAHAELRCGTGVVMVGSAPAPDFCLRSPRDLGGPTQGIYVVVADVEAHHRQATAAGATIVIPLADTSYGSREYTARDAEGGLWSFGTYRP